MLVYSEMAFFYFLTKTFFCFLCLSPLLSENYSIFVWLNNKYLEKMKKLILLFVLPLFIAVQSQAQTAQPAAANSNGPIAKWDKMANDFGSIAFNVPKTAEFTVTNVGKKPLIISSVRPSCGCTNPKFSQEPILPGKSSIVSATYNAANPGVFTKTVTVITNADTNPVVLQIKGTVMPNPNPPAPPVNNVPK